MSRNRNNPRILFVGEHPQTFSGNGNMLAALLQQIDSDEYNICAFVSGNVRAQAIVDPFFHPNFGLIPAYDEAANDRWGKRKLLEILNMYHFDQVIFVGLDIWRYADIFPQIQEIASVRNFILKAIFPYDLPYIREDWVEWIKMVHQPYVYSHFGYELLKPEVPWIEYFRPPLRNAEHFKPGGDDLRKKCREALFPDIDENTTIFGFVGNNQIRKNIPRMIKGFANAVSCKSNVILYIHAENPYNVYNLEQIAKDANIPENKIRFFGSGTKILPEQMFQVYSAMDCMLNFSVQEGLSWTMIEAMLMGLPILYSYTTAHRDYPKEIGISCKPDQETYIPLMTKYGSCYVETEACSASAIAHTILNFCNSEQTDKDFMEISSFEAGHDWINGCGNIGSILENNNILNAQSTGEYL